MEQGTLFWEFFNDLRAKFYINHLYKKVTQQNIVTFFWHRFKKKNPFKVSKNKQPLQSF
jgi:hypothetical protein